MNIRNLIRLLLYSPQYAKQSKKAGDKRSVGIICKDIVSLYRKYEITASEYLEKGIGVKSGNEREQALSELIHKHQWLHKYYDNWKFLSKYSGLEWQTSSKKRKQRSKAYIKRYNMGPHCQIQYGVAFIAEHYSFAKIKIGDNCLFARNCDIDITGDLEIGDNVGVLEGAKILTHAHDSYHFIADSEIKLSKRAYKTNLKIGNNVSICAHAIILPGVREIGENSIISAGAIVNRPVPANVIVAGNPAEVVRKIPAVVKRTKH